MQLHNFRTRIRALNRSRQVLLRTIANFVKQFLNLNSWTIGKNIFQIARLHLLIILDWLRIMYLCTLLFNGLQILKIIMLIGIIWCVLIYFFYRFLAIPFQFQRGETFELFLTRYKTVQILLYLDLFDFGAHFIDLFN